MLAVGLTAVLLVRAPVGAQQAEPVSTAAAQVRAVAAQTPPRVDGRLDDEVWRRAPFITQFVQREPEEGAPARERTEVAFAYDEDALYIGARLHSEDTAGVRALVTRRDREESSEQLIISLDTYRDRRTAYTFAVTAGGVRIDYYHAADFESRRDYTFDPVWEARTVVDSAGWTAEIRIPFTQLRFNAAPEQTWGVNVVRRIPARNEEAYWVLVKRNETGWSSRMGELVGIEGIRPSRRIEVQPYVATETRLAPISDPADPFAERRESALRAGGDLKMGLGPSLTLEATFNPDFGQVEADPAEVNLTAFETFFAERRPFFLEGTQIFGGRGNFYSRRIGAPPPVTPPADYYDSPSNTTILGAAKLSGRLPSGLSVGGLAAVTDEEEARTFDATNGSFGRYTVAPRTAYAVATAQQEFGSNASTASLMFTGVERDIDAASPLAPLLAQRAYTGIADTRIRWKGGQYDMSAYAGFSYVEGDSLAILGLQRSSRRYYQRPDADHVEVDRSRTSLGGRLMGINHSKLSGKHWLWDVDYFQESPGLELNDVGRLGSGDDHGLTWNLRYRETQPGARFRSYEIGTYHATEWNFGGVRNFSVQGAYFAQTWKNFWNSVLEVAYEPRSLHDQLTRGGPLMQTNATVIAAASLSGSPASRTRWSGLLRYAQDEADGWNAQLSGSLRMRPGARLEASLEPRLMRGVNPRQYVTTRGDGGPATFGGRYIFAAIDRSEVALRLRLNYALTPDLTLESYAEPFASSGDYDDFGELRAARSRELRFYGADGTTISAPDENGNRVVTDGGNSFTISNRDFNVRSLRSNVVLRWEWRRGSTAYLVWQQNRFSFDPAGDRVGPGGLFDAFDERGTHFLALKVAYWLPLR